MMLFGSLGFPPSKSPIVPRDRPFRVPPRAWAASSIIYAPMPSAICLNSSTGVGMPKRCWDMMARVFSDKFAFTEFMSGAKVRGSRS